MYVCDSSAHGYLWKKTADGNRGANIHVYVLHIHVCLCVYAYVHTSRIHMYTYMFVYYVDMCIHPRLECTMYACI